MQKFYLITTDTVPTKIFLQQDQALTFGKRLKIQNLGKIIMLLSQDITTSGKLINEYEIQVALTSINFTSKLLRNIKTIFDVKEFIRLIMKSETQKEYKQVLFSRLADKIHQNKNLLDEATRNISRRISVKQFIEHILYLNHYDLDLAKDIKY